MSSWKLIGGVRHVTAVQIVWPLAPFSTVQSIITINLKALPKATHTRLCNTIKQGYSTSASGVVGMLLPLFAPCNNDESWRAPEMPRCPEIGYLGKKAIKILVPTHELEERRTDYIAAMQMMGYRVRDTDHRESDTPGFSFFIVRSWDVDDGTGWNRHSQGYNSRALQPHSSKLKSLIDRWMAPTLPQRMPLYEWLRLKPTIVVRSVQRGAKSWYDPTVGLE